MSRPVKRSLTLKGHRTSVSLEDEFWRAFRDISEEKNTPINALAAEIDAARGFETGLATAIRAPEETRDWSGLISQYAG